ncbi:MAG: VOC family protein [Cytophagales bacterium]|jgi:catechol 2,3-dioxygenase-like lactoylglutathione lyase family enzyme|nr:VOC family protein [Cytophagales bacterium]
MNFTQIKETCLYVSDLEQTERFYNGLLGLPVIGRVAGRHVFFRAGSSVLLCFIAEQTRTDTHLPPHYGSGQSHLAFEVPPDEYEHAKAEIIRKGIEIIHEEPWGERFKSFYFHDSDGHVLEIVPAGMWGGNVE